MTSIDHGTYQALPARDSDDPPAGATHTVFGDGGYIAGYVSASQAWNLAGHTLGFHAGIRAAVAQVADWDRIARDAS